MSAPADDPRDLEATVLTTVLVIGTTRGTGRALAVEYARRGADVIVTGRSKDDAERIAAEIEGSVTGLALDLTRPAEIADACLFLLENPMANGIDLPLTREAAPN